MVTDLSWAVRLRELSQKSRKVLIEVNMNRRMYGNVMKFIGLNAIEGREPFFALAYYVRFAMPKAFLLLRTLELMKATGLFYHFVREVESDYNKYWIEQVSLELENRGKKARETTKESDCADLTDSILVETFVLFLYSLAMCAGCILIELASEHFRISHRIVSNEPVQILAQRQAVLFAKSN